MRGKAEHHLQLKLQWGFQKAPSNQLSENAAVLPYTENTGEVHISFTIKIPCGRTIRER